ncbi:Ketohexokinase like protein [Verticillium longisporum]|uniref:Ketohexokinase like protein n=2 Tax=Verticillium TaxID=1036719 RepID=A0A8I2ZET3_VERLO|nr:Ketohexokinase like protein [Verticillium longisporum]RXG45041.1 hypothetical protein VDGE_01448 [Verticillium dahliae]
MTPHQATQHIVLVGACYLDTILSVPRYPREDEKLRATELQVRRGGNCPNSLQVLRQLLAAEGALASRPASETQLHLVSPLPQRDSPATEQMLASFGRGPSPPVDFDHCLFRAGHMAPASCYVLRSAATGSRTIVNSNKLPDMTVREFAAIVTAMTGRAGGGRGDAGTGRDAGRWWWHFEGREPATTLACMRVLRRELGESVLISVEVEKPGREGLRALAAEADVAFFSKSWAEDCGYTSSEACLLGERPARAFLAFCTWGAAGAASLSLGEDACVHHPARVPNGDVVDTVGAGDTFIACVLYGLAHRCDWLNREAVLGFAVDTATLKVQREGFDGLATDALANSKHQLHPESSR